MIQGFEDILSQLSPEQLNQLMGLGVADDREKAIQNQLAQAEALRRAGGGSHFGLGAGIGAGIANAANGIGATIGTIKARGEQEKLLADKTEARKTFIDLLRQRQQPTASADYGFVPYPLNTPT